MSIKKLFPDARRKTVTTAGTRERLADVNVIAVALSIKALAGNAGKIYVGGSSVSSTVSSFELSSGESVSIKCNIDEIINLFDWWIDAANSGDSVSLAYLTKEDLVYG